MAVQRRITDEEGSVWAGPRGRKCSLKKPGPKDASECPLLGNDSEGLLYSSSGCGPRSTWVASEEVNRMLDQIGLWSGPAGLFMLFIGYNLHLKTSQV